MKAILTIGAPASGKSTFAKEWVNEKPSSRSYVERDEVRMELFYCWNYSDYKFSKANEERVTKAVKAKIVALAGEGVDICIADTNLNGAFRNELVEFLVDLGYEVEFKTFDVDFFELVKRDEKRAEKTVGRQVIYDFYRRMQDYLGKEKYVPQAKAQCYIFDIDGTLADMKGVRGPFDWGKVDQDKPVQSVINVLEALYEAGYWIVIMSGRDGSCFDKTLEWLDANIDAEYELFMRAAGDDRKDSIIKKELFDKHVAPRYHVQGVFDDRPQVCLMWQDLGIPLFKVGDMVKEF